MGCNWLPAKIGKCRKPTTIYNSLQSLKKVKVTIKPLEPNSSINWELLGLRHWKLSYFTAGNKLNALLTDFKRFVLCHRSILTKGSVRQLLKAKTPVSPGVRIQLYYFLTLWPWQVSHLLNHHSLTGTTNLTGWPVVRIKRYESNATGTVPEIH